MAGNSKNTSTRKYIRTTADVNLATAGSPHTMNVFKITGTVEILAAHGFITALTTLTNLTGLYFDLWDGTTAVEITSSTGGGTLSNAPVGSMIVKDKSNTEVVTCILADQCRVTEPTSDKKQHQPFSVTQNNGADTYIRCHFASTDDPIVFSIEFICEYEAIDGGKIELA